MSGVEIAGLVLATFPLVLSSIEQYTNFKFQTLRYVEIYGPLGALIPLLCGSDAWLLAQKILKTDDDKIVLDFVAAQIAQSNMVAVTGAIMAQVAITALTLDYLSTAHWVARAFFLSSLLAGCASVYYAMYQLRTFGRLITAKDVRNWLRGLPREIKDSGKNIPSAAAILVLDTPRGLVGMAATSFVCGLSIYIVFVFINNFDVNAGQHDSRNIVIAYFASMWLCGTLYSRSMVFDIFVDSTPTWKDLFRYLGFKKHGFSPKPFGPDADVEHGQHLPPAVSRTNPSSPPEMVSTSSVAAIAHAGQAASVIPRLTENPSATNNWQNAYPASNEPLSVTTALRDTIIARRRCLEADERLLNLLEQQRDGQSEDP